MDEVRYSDGEYLVTMGEVADALFFIKSGEVRARERVARVWHAHICSASTERLFYHTHRSEHI